MLSAIDSKQSTLSQITSVELAVAGLDLNPVELTNQRPTVFVHVSGGVIEAVFSTLPVNVVVLDTDTQGFTPLETVDFYGTRALVSHFDLPKQANCIQPEVATALLLAMAEADQQISQDQPPASRGT